MKNARGIVAAHVNERTQELWDEFREHARERGLSNTKALEQAAVLWVGQSVVFPVDDCPHCPDGHQDPNRGSQPWSAWVASYRDGDGQPMQITVARSAGAHVAESDAQWVRERLNTPTP